ncbi:homocitrate synthase [Zalerion maritima]|uniref:Homocitrate synthase n=1 Tax=Zalerion maritima TaxID=339359 RepID=A0AAD5RN31_9PEZI|nr:homocitrate synthase [Zalerion maritima]
MPLHLLPKKSWNVYNTENVARVRADEAVAAAAEAAEEEHLQEEDAARRLAILRGEQPLPLSRPTELPDPSKPPKRSRDDGGKEHRARNKRPRKHHGEDDTDFELRLARGRQEQAYAAQSNLEVFKQSAQITDERGNISLFNVESSLKHRQEPNPEAESEKRKTLERHDPTLRFANASGKDKSVLAEDSPWYKTAASEVDALANATGTDAFGRPDRERQARDSRRLNMADPLSLMKQGAKMVREVRKERDREREDRERVIRQLKKEERQERRERKQESREARKRGEQECRNHEKETDMGGGIIIGNVATATPTGTIEEGTTGAEAEIVGATEVEEGITIRDTINRW